MARRFRVLLFDLGHTLLYFDGDAAQVAAEADAVLLQALQQAGLRLNGERFLREFRARMEAYFVEREIGFVEHTTASVLRSVLAEMVEHSPPEAVLRSALDRMYAVSQAHWRREEDAIPTLAALRQRGYRLGLISNAADDQDVQTLVEVHDLRPFFEIVLTSAACGVRKPDPAIFHQALQMMDATPAQAVMIGDTLNADILGAHNAGMFSIWITRRADTPANRAQREAIQPDATVRTLEELLTLFP